MILTPNQNQEDVLLPAIQSSKPFLPATVWPWALCVHKWRHVSHQISWSDSINGLAIINTVPEASLITGKISKQHNI